MKVIYHDQYNIDLGLLNYLHPFDGRKFRRVYGEIKNQPLIDLAAPSEQVSMAEIDTFLTSMMRKKVRDRVFIFRALEVPKLPFISFNFLDKKILQPMRWGVAGTILGAEQALAHGDIYWNLSGGYHHAMPQNMEGFCIYNDVGICYQQLIKNGLIKSEDKILIIDTDAHHGNGNAYTFLENDLVTLLDVYNSSIYPNSGSSRKRVDIAVPLIPGTDGETYIARYQEALQKVTKDYKLAFVVAGTDVLLSDRLGGLCLSIDDVVTREKLTLARLRELGIPAVILGGGGYSKESASAISAAILACSGE